MLRTSAHFVPNNDIVFIECMIIFGEKYIHIILQCTVKSLFTVGSEKGKSRGISVFSIVNVI